MTVISVLAAAARDASVRTAALPDGFYQNASVQVSIVQLHPNLDDPHLGPGSLDAGDGVVAAGGGSAVRLCGGGGSQGGGGGLIGWRRRVDIQTGYRGGPHVLQQKQQGCCSLSRVQHSDRHQRLTLVSLDRRLLTGEWKSKKPSPSPDRLLLDVLKLKTHKHSLTSFGEVEAPSC